MGEGEVEEGEWGGMRGRGKGARREGAGARSRGEACSRKREAEISGQASRQQGGRGAGGRAFLCSPFFSGFLGFDGAADGAAAVAEAGWDRSATLAISARRSRILASSTERSSAHAAEAWARSK